MRGGGFLIEDEAAERSFTPEDWTDEHRAIARATEEFSRNEIEPRLDAIQRQEPGVAAGVLRRSAALGLTAVLVPEAYGGMEMDLTSAMIVAEGIAKDGSYAAWHGAHSGIGTLPLLLYGTAAQKERYLGRLASAEWIGAYCLSEAHAGSDALAATTRADLTPDGAHYVLNGQKMWITNGGAADLYTVFAKVGGEQFTAFLVERAWPGVSTGAEEHKMGIRGSSTTPVFFDNVRVPAGNVLGEVGQGHRIAFNILNLGRLKLGPFAVGGMKEVLRVSLRYAAERVAFGKPIGEFGLIQAKLADMALRIYASETLHHRVTGWIEERLAGWSWAQPDAAAVKLKAVEEYAAECSFIKVFASEALDFVVDEGVQIHGGYGYHQDYLVERAYRDSRINRIFEGTNEINRMLATGMLLKRALRGQLPLVAAIGALQRELLAGPALAAEDPETSLVASAKKSTLLAMGVAYERFGARLEEQQEVLAGLSDLAMHTLVMESALLRARKHGVAPLMTALLLRESAETMGRTARAVLGGCAEGDLLRTHLAALRRFTRIEPVDGIALRRQIAGRLREARRYVLA